LHKDANQDIFMFSWCLSSMSVFFFILLRFSSRRRLRFSDECKESQLFPRDNCNVFVEIHVCYTWRNFFGCWENSNQSVNNQSISQRVTKSSDYLNCIGGGAYDKIRSTN